MSSSAVAGVSHRPGHSSVHSENLRASDKQILKSVEKSHHVKRKNRAKGADDRSTVDLSAVYKSLTVLGQEVVKKLNDLLKNEVPGGIESLKPENHTAEKTAQRIVDGVTGLLAVFQKQNSNLEGEALLEKFMSTIRGGIQQGYNQASKTLGDIGAFQFAGVEDGIKETMKLVDQKLQAFEDNYRKEHGLTVTQETETSSAQATGNALLPQAGVSLKQAIAVDVVA